MNMFFRKFVFRKIIEIIEYADDCEIDAVIHALMRREKRCFPEYELVILSLPKNEKEARADQLARMVDILQRG